MKNIKFLLTLLVAAVAVTFTSCSESDWTPGAKDSAQSVYLSSEQTKFIVDMESTSVDLPIFRNQAGEALTVSFLVDDQSGIFNVPSTVTFAAEDIQTVMTISFDTAEMELGVNYPIAIQVKNEENKGNYGPSTLDITIGLPEPWNTGTGIYRDDFFCNLVDGLAPGYMAYVEVQQHAEQTNRIRIPDLFGREMTGAFYGGLPQWMQWSNEIQYVEFDVTNPEAVVLVGLDEAMTKAMEVPCSYTGLAIVTEENGPFVDMYLAHTGAAEAPGMYLNDIISFPTPRSFWFIDHEGYGYQMNTSGMFAIAMPGATFSDTSISAAYGGMKVAANNKDAEAIVDFTLGYDVTSYKFAVIDADDALTTEEVLAGIKEGTLEEGVIESTPDVTTWEVAVAPGLFTVVAVSYMDGEVCENFVGTFYFPGMTGGELPEATLSMEVGPVSSFTGNAEHDVQFPASSAMAIMVQGIASEVTAVMYAVVAGAPADYDSMEIIRGYGRDATATVLEDFAEYADAETGIGYSILPFTGLTAGTTYNCFMYFDTIYGERVFRIDYTVPAAEDNGEAETSGVPVLSSASLELMPRLVRDITPYEGIYVPQYTRKSVQRLF